MSNSAYNLQNCIRDQIHTKNAIYFHSLAAFAADHMMATLTFDCPIISHCSKLFTLCRSSQWSVYCIGFFLVSSPAWMCVPWSHGNGCQIRIFICVISNLFQSQDHMEVMMLFLEYLRLNKFQVMSQKCVCLCVCIYLFNGNTFLISTMNSSFLINLILTRTDY